MAKNPYDRRSLLNERQKKILFWLEKFRKIAGLGLLIAAFSVTCLFIGIIFFPYDRAARQGSLEGIILGGTIWIMFRHGADLLGEDCRLMAQQLDDEKYY